jgi:hypothetical protein
MTISDDSRDDGKFADGATRTRTVSRSRNGIGNGASVKEGSTMKAIRFTQLQVCPQKIIKNSSKTF